MTRIAVLLLVLGLGFSCTRPVAEAPSVATSEAPQIEMKTYYMGFLKRGPNWTPDEENPEVRTVLEGHMNHIQTLAQSGQLLLAGPFIHGEDAPEGALAGIFLFDVPSLTEAQALIAADPGVKAGRFIIDVLPWYGPAGLTYTGREAFLSSSTS